ncbi:hypothetical protein EDD22DRAFT_872200 [Suillus occidentalis]|nr:hypothetical protein EDD22DRAFT_872200 [Suillus occidentalis]
MRSWMSPFVFSFAWCQGLFNCVRPQSDKKGVSTYTKASVLKIVKMNGRSTKKCFGVVGMNAGRWGHERRMWDRGSRCVPCGTGYER